MIITTVWPFASPRPSAARRGQKFSQPRAAHWGWKERGNVWSVQQTNRSCRRRWGRLARWAELRIIWFIIPRALPWARRRYGLRPKNTLKFRRPKTAAILIIISCKWIQTAKEFNDPTAATKGAKACLCLKVLVRFFYKPASFAVGNLSAWTLSRSSACFDFRPILEGRLPMPGGNMLQPVWGKPKHAANREETNRCLDRRLPNSRPSDWMLIMWLLPARRH
jgi:hypothetical protein